MLLLVVFMVVGLAPRAAADSKVTITITNGKPSPNPAEVDSNGTVTWYNSDDSDHAIYSAAGGGPLVTVLTGQSANLPVAATLLYKIDNKNPIYTVNVIDTSAPSTIQPVTVPPTSAPTTTTTPTTVAPPTTDTTPVTDTTSTTTSTTEPSTTTTAVATESALIPIGESTGGGRSSALPWLAGSSIVVAGLAGFVYYLWWRSGEVPKELAEQPEAPTG
jgi:hypothetical protein